MMNIEDLQVGDIVEFWYIKYNQQIYANGRVILDRFSRYLIPSFLLKTPNLVGLPSRYCSIIIGVISVTP